MSFLNNPTRSIQASVTSVIGVEQMPWYNPLDLPTVPPAIPVQPVMRDFKWEVIMNIDEQMQSSSITRNPGVFDGQDINVGQWIANVQTGQAWQIISIEAKTTEIMTAIVQDIYRYNTFNDPTQVGNGAPPEGIYVIFSLSDAGLPVIDPIPPSGVSMMFGINLQSRFEYINLQYDFPLYQKNNTFVLDDVIAASPVTHTFILPTSTDKNLIGRVTSISDTAPGWFTINPLQKIVDYLNYLPGNIGDLIYSDNSVPGGVTITPGGTPLYVKLRNNTSSLSFSETLGPTTPGNVFQLNGVDITVGGTGSASDLVSVVNPQASLTGVTSSLVYDYTNVTTNNALITVVYGEPILWATSSPATATINGVLVTFNVASTVPGYTNYARVDQMAQLINAASIPNIVASVITETLLDITNVAGGAITIVNMSADMNGINFAGASSGSGLALSTSASLVQRVKFLAVDARPINFFDVAGTLVEDFGLISVENGTKAAGLYIESSSAEIDNIEASLGSMVDSNGVWVPNELTNTDVWPTDPGNLTDAINTLADYVVDNTTTGTVRTVSGIVPLNANGTINVGTVIPANVTIISVYVNIDVIDASALLSIGKIGNISKYMNTTENDTSSLGLYLAEVSAIELTSTQVIATVTGSSNVGSGTCYVVVEYKMD